MKFLVVFIVILFTITSCTTYSEEELNRFDQRIQTHLDSTNTAMERAENGLYYSIIEKGHGEEYIQYKDQITFTYKGSFLDGSTFQIIDKNDPLKYKVKQLIIGWQDALMMLKEGGKINIIVPPQLGYAKQKTDLIPANTILKYELEVLEVK